MRISGARLAAGLALLTAGVGGCGQDKLDIERAEAAIGAGITRQTGVKIVSVRCPEEVEVSRGDTFRCVARGRHGERARVEVTQRDDEGGVTWRLVGGS